MIEVNIPKDIMKYKPKLVGPLTARQCISGGLCLGVFGILFLTVYNILPLNVFAIIVIICCVPCLALNFQVYGLPMEKYMQTAFKTTFLAKKHRKYRTANTFAPLTEAYAHRKTEKQEKKKKRKESQEFRAYR